MWIPSPGFPQCSELFDLFITPPVCVFAGAMCCTILWDVVFLFTLKLCAMSDHNFVHVTFYEMCVCVCVYLLTCLSTRSVVTGQFMGTQWVSLALFHYIYSFLMNDQLS